MLAGGLPLGPVKAAGIAGGIAALVAGLSIGPTRKLLTASSPIPARARARRPARRASSRSTSTPRRAGARTSSARSPPGRPRLQGDRRDARRGGLALALDGEQLPDAAGVLTPATGIGDGLAERLRAAGHSYDVHQH